MPFVFEVSKCCLVILTFGVNWLSNKSRKLDEGVQGKANIDPGGTFAWVRKTGRKTNALLDERFKQMAPTREPKSDSLVYLG